MTSKRGNTNWRRQCLMAGTLTLMILSPFANAADEYEYESFMMGDFVVDTASRKSETTRDAASNITVVTSTQIKEWGLRDLSDVMRRIAGYTVVYDRDEISYAARGNVSDNNQKYLILIDGHQMNSTENFGPGNIIELPNDLSSVKQIEVIKGPGSVVWGAGALAGVINIKTLDAADLAGKSHSSVSYGSNSTIVANFQTGMKLYEDVSVAFFGSFAQSNGAEVVQSAATGFPILSGPSVPAGWPGKYHTLVGNLEPSYMLQMKANIGKVKFNAMTFYNSIFNRHFESDRGRENYLDNQKFFMEGSYTTSFDNDLEFSAKVSYHNNHAEYRPGKQGTESKLPVNISWNDNRVNMNFVLSKTWNESFDTDIALDYTNTRHGPNQRINSINPDNAGAITQGFWLDNYVIAQTYGGYAMANYQVNKSLKLSGGVWVDLNNDMGNDPLNVSPRIGMVWKATDTSTFKLLYNQAFLRPANFQAVNNPDVNSETMEQLDLIWMQEWGKTALTVNAYMQKLEGFLNIVSIGNVSRFSASGTYKSKGVEVDLSTRVTDDLSFWANAALIEADAEDFPGGLAMDTRRVTPDGKQLSYPATTANAGATLRMADRKFFVSPAIRYTGEIDYRESPAVGSLENATYAKAGKYFQVDLSVGWEPSDRFGVYFNVVNLLDETEPTALTVWNGTITQPGTYMEFTARFAF